MRLFRVVFFFGGGGDFVVPGTMGSKHDLAVTISMVLILLAMLY